MKLVKAIEVASAYAITEESVQIISARQLDLAQRWFLVEGVRKAFRRTYIVDMQEPEGFVVELLGVHITADEADLITRAIAQRKAEEV